MQQATQSWIILFSLRFSEQCEVLGPQMGGGAPCQFVRIPLPLGRWRSGLLEHGRSRDLLIPCRRHRLRRTKPRVRVSGGASSFKAHETAEPDRWMGLVLTLRRPSIRPLSGGSIPLTLGQDWPAPAVPPSGSAQRSRGRKAKPNVGEKPQWLAQPVRQPRIVRSTTLRARVSIWSCPSSNPSNWASRGAIASPTLDGMAFGGVAMGIST